MDIIHAEKVSIAGCQSWVAAGGGAFHDKPFVSSEGDVGNGLPGVEGWLGSGEARTLDAANGRRGVAG